MAAETTGPAPVGATALGRDAAREAAVGSLPPPLRAFLRHAPNFVQPVHFGWKLSQRWASDRCALIAAALAFFGLVSIFPIVLAAVAILSRTLVSRPDTLVAFHAFVKSFFPGAAGEVTHQLDAVAHSANPATLGGLAVASLLWSGRAYFATLAGVMNSIWPQARPRPFLQNQLALWSLFVGAGLLWLLSTLATFSLRTAQAIAQSSPDFFINRSPLVWNYAGKLLSFGLTTLMFWLLYRFLPNVKARRHRVVWGASILGGIGWESAKWLFTNVIGAHVSHYQATYGSAAGVVLTLLWIYLSSCILLLGAEAAAVYEELNPLEPSPAEPSQAEPSPAGASPARSARPPTAAPSNNGKGKA